MATSLLTFRTRTTLTRWKVLSNVTDRRLLHEGTREIGSKVMKYAEEKMTAVQQIIYGGPFDALHVVQVPVPIPKSNQLLIRVNACSVNPLDVAMREGYGKEAFETQRKLPVVLGRDCSGVVVSTGPSVWNFKKGDEVYAATSPLDYEAGSYAQFVAINEHYVAKKPKNLDFREAAAIPFAGLTAWEAVVNVANVKRGQTVLVLGAAGGVGTIAVQLLKRSSCVVHVTCSGKDKALLDSLGADYVYDYKKVSVKDIPVTFDIVIDLVGGQSRNESFRKLNSGGHLVSTTGSLLHFMDAYGVPFGILGATAELFGEKAMRGREGIKYDWVYYKSNGKALEEMTKLVESGKLKPIVDSHLFTLSDMPLAHQRHSDPSHQGKVVVTVPHQDQF